MYQRNSLIIKWTYFCFHITLLYVIIVVQKNTYDYKRDHCNFCFTRVQLVLKKEYCDQEINCYHMQRKKRPPGPFIFLLETIPYNKLLHRLLSQIQEKVSVYINRKNGISKDLFFEPFMIFV